MHAIRTAEILDLKCVIFARGKMPADDILARADEIGLVVLLSRHTMFTSAGLLYEGGLRGAALPTDETAPQAS